MATDDPGVLISEVRYSAFGEVRYDSSTMTTDYLYTGQRQVLLPPLIRVHPCLSVVNLVCSLTCR